MNSIDQAIRESLLESFLYRQSFGGALLPDQSVLDRIYRRSKVSKYWFLSESSKQRDCRKAEEDNSYLLQPNKGIYRIELQDYLRIIQMHELQKNRAE